MSKTIARVLDRFYTVCGFAFLLMAIDGYGPVPAQSTQALDQAANDPTASLMSLQLADWNAFKYHNADTSDNSVVLRVATPFSIGDQKHILRITAPFITSHPTLQSGLSDITVFDLMVFDRPWGRFGVGAVAVAPTGGASRGADQWGLGPAAGFVAQEKKFLWGLFNQNVFKVAGASDRGKISGSSLQPIFSYRLGNGWNLGSSEMQVTYSWADHRWSSLPAGISASKLHRFEKIPVQFSVQYEHDFADDRVSPGDTVRLTMKFLLPSL